MNRSRSLNRTIRVAFCALAIAGVAGPCLAETLQDALALAYQSNPVLRGQRDQQQALDETYVQAKAGLAPTASFTAQGQFARGPNSLAFNQGFSNSNDGAPSVNITQPLYTGGRTTWAMRAAQASVAAGREDLRSVESQVLLSAIQGYVDVLRDQQILQVRQADMATLEHQVAESSAKYDLGHVTKTDVAQAQAQLESARASLAAAQAQLQISRAEYQAAIGQAPGALADPGDLPGMPKSIDEAFDLAEASNPMLLQSQLKEKASHAQIAAAKSAYGPTVALQGSVGYIGPISPLDTRAYGPNESATLSVTLPLLTGGVAASQVRQAVAQNGSDIEAIEATRRQVVQGVSQAWSQLLAGQIGVTAGGAQVKAAETALKGSQAEYSYGLRTTLDVLIADENLRAAQLSLAQSRHDAFLAAAAVLLVCGRLEIRSLIPGEPTYDPKRNFDRVDKLSRSPVEAVALTIDGLGAAR
jgi:outer membrane protein